MSVIGRLDSQVDELIIKPVGERKSRESLETERASSKETKETFAQPQARTEEDAAEGRDKTRTQASELPVWLL